MSHRLKKSGLIIIDILLAAYIVASFSAFNKPEEKSYICKGVNVVVEDAISNGFIDTDEVKSRIDKAGLNPKGKMLKDISCRKIEETLMQTPFVKNAQCFKTQSGIVTVSITQRMPVVRIMSVNKDDFYVDDHDCIMPNSLYTSDIIIATGYISRSYATLYIAPLARTLIEDDLCRNLIEQINITKNREVELIPRVGDNIIYLGRLPESNIRQERLQEIQDFVRSKMKRLELFYKYGLPQAGWNKYSEISLEFDNQIICKRKETDLD